MTNWEVFRVFGSALLFFGLVSGVRGKAIRSPRLRRARGRRRAGTQGDYPSWFEIRQSGNSTLVGSYVGQFGSARPISKVNFDKGEIGFTVPPQWERRNDDVTVRGKFVDDRLRGEVTDDSGKLIQWEARRAPRCAKRRRNGPML